ncbi:hypothetical protein MTR67_043463 [Solanum verrucosum]|uniref:Reverse transcriptase zinc-binding domain-containing protein n=1 Tax=Solanum verrucosum TaxID=315347 RepID=A0AAF0UNS4_SOLVR|nr:hypothetical protein MTR67_043463 [Solanum verrucosum]
MAAISPPNTTMKYIDAIIADFYWGRDQDKRKYHWASLDTMSLPYTEGRVGIRRLSDICTSLQYEQWWNFRSKVTLWSQFLKSNFCQRAHPVAKKVDIGQSLMWRYMMKNKIKAEENIGWKISSGSCSFWWDDWLGGGAPANYTNDISTLNNATIAHFLVNGKWNEKKLRQQVPLIILSILNTNFQLVQGTKDSAVWKLTDSGKFTCKSTWEICRKKKDIAVINSQLWHRHIPFKMSFLLWRAIRHKFPTNETLANFGVEPVKCYCCIQQGWDEVDHIFIQGHFAGHIWKFFAGSMGLIFQQTSLVNQIMCWSGITGKNTAHTTIIKTLPIVICWNLWKNRCAAKYGGKTTSIHKVKYLIIKDMFLMLTSVFPYLQLPVIWPELGSRPDNCIKYFRFLNCWVEQPSFEETVIDCWNRPIEGDAMWTFHQKMKRLASTLSAWSKMKFGDIYAKIKEFEERVKVAEDNILQNHTEKHREDLHSINAEYIKYMKLEDSILKQKSQLHWFKEGDGNSKYFHALIRGRRRRLFVHKILNENDEWIQGDEQIAQTACDYFQHIFTGGIGVRQMSDVCQAFQFKHWWVFRTKQTLWGDFLRAKYCQRSNPISKKWDTGDSQAWKLLMKNKHKVKNHIQWKIRNGSCSVWWDNWLGVGPLAQFTTNSHRFDNETIADFMANGQWNVDKLIQLAPQNQLHTILSTQLQLQHTSSDQAVWKFNSIGLFTVSSAWDIIREKRTKTKINSYTWNHYIPFKCSFLLWRTIRGKLPTNERLDSFGIEQRDCYCCHSPGFDTIEHIFNLGNLAKIVWKFFCYFPEHTY